MERRALCMTTTRATGCCGKKRNEKGKRLRWMIFYLDVFDVVAPVVCALCVCVRACVRKQPAGTRTTPCPAFLPSRPIPVVYLKVILRSILLTLLRLTAILCARLTQSCTHLSQYYHPNPRLFSTILPSSISSRPSPSSAHQLTTIPFQPISTWSS